MNQEVNKLQELLARVKRNAALPRTLVSGRAPEPLAPVYEPPAAAFSPPAYIPPPSEISADEVFFDSEAPPPPSVPTAIPPAQVAQAAIDASVDELLLEDPFPSVPPGPSYSDVLEDPMPVAATGAPRQLDHEEDVSGVMSISEFSDEQPEELLEDDIVEMTATEAAAIPMVQNSLDELSFADVDLDDKQAAAPSEEEPPVSSSRSKVAGTMDEALARAAEQIELEEGREVPLKTPPPESGPQAAVMPQGMHAPLAPDIEELLEADILPSTGVRAAVPTAEQVGQTVDLDEARGPSLELDHAAASSTEELEEEAVASEELEVTLPGREFGGGYQADLMPPPEARQDLDAHRQREEAIPPPPESLAQYPSPAEAQPSAFAPVIVPSSVTTDSYSESVSTVTVDAPPNAEFAPELLARPEIGPSPVAKFIRAEAQRPKTFMELLDSSLSLGSD